MLVAFITSARRPTFWGVAAGEMEADTILPAKMQGGGR